VSYILQTNKYNFKLTAKNLNISNLFKQKKLKWSSLMYPENFLGRPCLVLSQQMLSYILYTLISVEWTAWILSNSNVQNSSIRIKLYFPVNCRYAAGEYVSLTILWHREFSQLLNLTLSNFTVVSVFLYSLYLW